MSTTFASRLASDTAARDLKWCAVVQGVPFAFTSSRTSPPDAVVALAGYGTGVDHVRVPCIAKVEQAAKELDLVQRRMVGGSLTLDLLDDDAGTLRTLFTPRRRRTTFVNNPADTSQPEFSVASVAGASAPGVIYVDGETCKFGSLTASEYATLTRGAFGSEAQNHYGDAVQGASVFTTPPAWTGRRVKLIAYFEREDGTTTAALAKVVDTYRLEAPPKWIGGGTWQLQCSHLSDEFAAKKVGSGQRTVEGRGTRTVVGGLDNYLLPNGSENLFDPGASRTTYARIRGSVVDFNRTVDGQIVSASERAGAAAVQAINSRVGTAFLADTTNLLGAPPVDVPADYRHIALVGVGHPVGEDLVALLVSRLGDGANGPYDVYPGVSRDAFGEADWRFGAGINKSEVDDAAFVDVGQDAAGWSFVVDDEHTVEDVLASFCLAAGACWFVTGDGLLSVKRLAEERVDSALTLSASNVIEEPVVEYDEADIAPRVRLSCNYDTVAEKFLAVVQVLDSEIASRFPTHDARVEIESRGLTIQEALPAGALPLPTTTLADVQALLRTLQKTAARGRLRLPLRCTVDALVLDLGDVVTLDVSAPDLEGAATLAGKTARVIRLGPRLDEGVVDVDVEVLETLYAVAPSCVIASRAGAVLTLRTGGPEVAGARSSTPGRLFFAGAWVRLYDVSAATFEDAEVLSVTDTTVTLTAAPALVVAANVDVLTMSDQFDVSAFPAGTNLDGYGHADYAYQMPDDDDDIVAGGAGATYATRYR